MFSVLLLSSCGSESTETVQENKYEVLIENSCGFDKDVINKKVYAFASDIDADNALEKIMKLTGLPPNFEIKSANVDNACAVVECDDKGGCKRIIYYNQEFIEKMNDATNTDYTELAILAHEIGHHLSGHTIAEPKNRHEEELEADKFAGFILHQLGASIETAKNVFSYSPEEGSQTHPPKAARIAAITNGWYDSKRKGNSISGSGTINQKTDFENLRTYNYDDNEIYIEYNTSSSSINTFKYFDDFSDWWEGADTRMIDYVEKTGIVEEAIYNSHTYYDQRTMKLLNGRVVQYYENGKQKFNFYVINGKVNGKVIWRNKDGKVIIECSLSNGLLDGLYKENLLTYSFNQLWSKGDCIWDKNYRNMYYHGYYPNEYANKKYSSYRNYSKEYPDSETYKILNWEVSYEYNKQKLLKKSIKINYRDKNGYVRKNKRPRSKILFEINDSIGISKIYDYNFEDELIYPLVELHTILEHSKDKYGEDESWKLVLRKMGLPIFRHRDYKWFKIKKIEWIEYNELGEITSRTKSDEYRKSRGYKPKDKTESLLPLPVADSTMEE